MNGNEAERNAWTPEPWTTQRSPNPVDGEYDYAIHAGSLRVIAEVFGRATSGFPLPAEATANRIVACVMALRGIPDPEEFITRAKRMEEALRPFAAFAEAWESKPLSGMDDGVYRIHAGTEWEGVLRLSDCRKAREALKAKEGN